MSAKKVKLQPLGSNVLVEPIQEDKYTQSGIVLPDTVDKEKPQKGKVIAVGKGKTKEDGKVIPMNVKVGDVVIFKKYSPDEIEADGETYLIMEEGDILAVVGE